jgi:hypothetical protein
VASEKNVHSNPGYKSLTRVELLLRVQRRQSVGRCGSEELNRWRVIVVRRVSAQSLNNSVPLRSTHRKQRGQLLLRVHLKPRRLDVQDRSHPWSSLLDVQADLFGCGEVILVLSLANRRGGQVGGRVASEGVGRGWRDDKGSLAVEGLAACEELWTV